LKLQVSLFFCVDCNPAEGNAICTTEQIEMYDYMQENGMSSVEALCATDTDDH
jgi:hypothetical protein